MSYDHIYHRHLRYKRIRLDKGPPTRSPYSWTSVISSSSTRAKDLYTLKVMACCSNKMTNSSTLILLLFSTWSEFQNTKKSTRYIVASLCSACKLTQQLFYHSRNLPLPCMWMTDEYDWSGSVTIWIEFEYVQAFFCYFCAQKFATILCVKSGHFGYSAVVHCSVFISVHNSVFHKCLHCARNTVTDRGTFGWH